MTHQSDFEKLKSKGCTDIKGGLCGKASLAHGYHHPSRNRLFVLRYDDRVVPFKVRSSDHLRRSRALVGAKIALMQDYPSAGPELDMVLAG